MWRQNNNTSAKNTYSANQVQLMNALNKLWIEHVLWTRAFLVSTAENLKDLDAVTKRLLRNPADFANELRPLYGSQAAARFEDLFREHLLIAAQLVNAAKAGDTKAADEQRDKWYANADEIADFLSRINPYWDAETWRIMLYNHLEMTENEAVQLLTGQYAASIAQYDAIEDQALNMAAEMADGIMKQFRM